jgi:hypothetical protein
MTYAPADLLAVRRYLLSTLDMHPGVVPADLDPAEVGIVGDPDHAASGGYHEGNDDLARVGRLTSDYSKRESARDRPGSNAASALDIGDFRHVRPDGTVVTLRSLSLGLAAACQRGDPRAADVREVIYTPDGVTVRRFDRLGIRTTGDSSHLYHTHISFFRASEGRRAQPGNVLGLLQSLIEGDDDVNAEQDTLLKSDAWRTHTIINDEEKVPAAAPNIAGQPNLLRARLVGMEGKVDQLLTAAAADAARDAAMKVVLDALAAGGTSVDTAAVIARINEVAATESTTVADLRAEVASLRADLAEAAQAAAAAFDA